jgi:hypothetical protein
MTKIILAVFVTGFALAGLVRYSSSRSRLPASHAALVPLMVQKETAPLPDEMPDWWRSEDLNIAEPHQ